MFKWPHSRIRAVEILKKMFLLYNIQCIFYVCLTFTLNCQSGFIVENIYRGHYGNKMDTSKSLAYNFFIIGLLALFTYGKYLLEFV